MGKLLLLTLNEQEETVIDKIISEISDYVQIEPMQIRQHVYGRISLSYAEGLKRKESPLKVSGLCCQNLPQ